MTERTSPPDFLGERQLVADQGLMHIWAICGAEAAIPTARKGEANSSGIRIRANLPAEYQPLLDNAKKLRALLAELQDLTLEIIDKGSARQP